jgi:nickel/cobalt transporter (NicO) family protein
MLWNCSRATGRSLVLALALLFLPAMAAKAQAPQAPSGPSPSAPAQTSPAPRGLFPPKAERPTTPAAQPSGLFGGAYLWIMARQQEINRNLADAIRRLKAGDGLSAALLLGGLSFAYGVLHAAGPGHGKAVISSYVLADGQTMRRGVMLAFMAAFVQALAALLLVAILVLVLKSTRTTIVNTELWLERASWAFVACFGAWLLWRQVRPLLTAAPAHSHAGHAHAHHDHADHDHAHHDHAHKHHDHGAAAHKDDHHLGHDHAHHDHAHAAGDACETCGHAHMPAPDALKTDWSWRRAMTLAVAIGIRPCTGAILVLVFAISQGLMWAGVFATFAMAIGTAITVSALAALAVGSRDLATRLAGARQPRWAGHVQSAVGIAGAALVMTLGASFFYYSLNGAGPL